MVEEEREKEKFISLYDKYFLVIFVIFSASDIVKEIAVAVFVAVIVCQMCGESVQSVEDACQAAGQLYHTSCFVCTSCGTLHHNLCDRIWYCIMFQCP